MAGEEAPVMEETFAPLGSPALDGETFVSSLYPVASQLSLPRANSEAEFQDFLKRMPSSSALVLLDEPSPSPIQAMLPRVPSLDFIRAFLSANRTMPDFAQQALCSTAALPPFDLDGALAPDAGQVKVRDPHIAAAGAAGAAAAAAATAAAEAAAPAAAAAEGGGCDLRSPSDSEDSESGSGSPFTQPHLLPNASPVSARCATMNTHIVPDTPCAGGAASLNPFGAGVLPAPAAAGPYACAGSTLPISALHAAAAVTAPQAPAAAVCPGVPLPGQPGPAGPATAAALLAPSILAASAFIGPGQFMAALPRLGMLAPAACAGAGGCFEGAGGPSSLGGETPTGGGGGRGRRGAGGGGGGRRGRVGQQVQQAQQEEGDEEGTAPGEPHSEVEATDRQEARRARRMMSNRESARRSRKRKQEHLLELEQQVSMLETSRVELLAQLSRMQGVLASKDVELAAMGQELSLLRQENASFRAMAEGEQEPVQLKRGRYPMRHSEAQQA